MHLVGRPRALVCRGHSLEQLGKRTTPDPSADLGEEGALPLFGVAERRPDLIREPAAFVTPRLEQLGARERVGLEQRREA